MNFTEGFGKKWIDRILGKVDKDQGVANAGKVLGIGDDGQVVPVEQSGGGSGESTIKFGDIIAELKAGNDVKPLAVFISSGMRTVYKNDNDFTATIDNDAKTIRLEILRADQLLASKSNSIFNEQEIAILNTPDSDYFEIGEMGTQTIQFQCVNPVTSENMYVYFDYVNTIPHYNSTRIMKRVSPTTMLGEYTDISLKDPYLNKTLTANGWTVSCDPFIIGGLRPISCRKLNGFYIVTGKLA